MRARRILVVEDDPAVAPLLVELLSTEGYAVRTAGARLTLRRSEYALVIHFAAHPGSLLSASELAQAVLHLDDEASRNAITTQLRRLRGRLKQAGLPPLFETVSSGGYRIIVRNE